MSKRLILILALAFVVGITFAAYAEVQNVKVSGDITVKAVARNDFDLTKPMEPSAIRTSNFEDKNRDFLSITRVRVDADLTDNVSTTVRLLNERNWNGEGAVAGLNANRNIGLNTGVGVFANENEIDLDLAYVTLKEFLYSPLSLTIGRQELHFGNELIVGDPDTNIYSATTNLSEGDLSARKSFDAVRATLDYNPLVVDVVYAKIQEGMANLNDDVTLAGFNASYALTKNTNVETFLFSKVRGKDGASATNVDSGLATSFANAAGPFGAAAANRNNAIKDQTDIVNSVGVRVTDKTVKNLSLDGTLAYQFGKYNPKFDPNARFDTVDTTRHAQTTGRSAWAAQLMAAYDLKDIAKIAKYSPVVAATYTYLSGANRDAESRRAYKGWDPMFENQTIGHIMNAIFTNSNMHRASLSAKAKLTDDISANVDYVGGWFAKKYPADANRRAILSGINLARQFTMTGGKFIGQEIDGTIIYDYTEDVQFSLLGGIFLVGKNIRNIDTADKGQNAASTEVIGSMKVTF